MKNITNEFANNFANEYLLAPTIVGLESINDKLSVVKFADKEDIRIYIESYVLFGFSPEEAVKFQFSQSISRIVYRRVGTIIENLVYESFNFSKKYDCRKNVKFRDLVSDNANFEKVKNYSSKEAGDVILFDKNYCYEVKWSFATTAGNELNMILAKAALCKRINYTPILLLYNMVSNLD